MGESGEYTVKIDATDPSASVVSSPTHPDVGVAATEIFKSNEYVRLNITKNRR